MFKDVLRRRHMDSKWYEFRTELLREIAIGWCKDHGIQWTDQPAER